MGDQTGCDWRAVVAELNGLLRLKTTITAMKLFERVEDMEAVPRIRRPQAVHTTDQVVSMASRLGWTVGITADDLVGPQCKKRGGGEGAELLPLHSLSGPQRCAAVHARAAGCRGTKLLSLQPLWG